ncbi:MAG: hypothetical protein NE328_14575 [Lentisphaeraceae bacterium]|nr:hypothetical protein [Lentisphaeraceae bacterium]
MLRLLLFLIFCLSAKAEQTRPNILFIFSDDHTLQTLGTHKGRMHKGSTGHPYATYCSVSPKFSL